MKYQNQLLGVILLSLCVFVFVYRYQVIDVEQFITSDRSYQGANITSNQFEPPPTANFGVNIWRKSFRAMRILSADFQRQKKHTRTHSLTGLNSI